MKRIIDANLNRAREGIRVLEDIARFFLEDEEIFKALRNLRHSLKGEAWVISDREAEGDIGRDRGKGRYKDALELVISNSRRVEESLRVLEEISRLCDFGINSEELERARFSIYEVEKKLVTSLERLDKVERIRGIYVIVDAGVLGEGEVEAARRAVKGGADVIQLRDKVSERGEILRKAREIKRICDENGIPFIVNDHVDIALIIGATGVHLGRKDIPPDEARKIFPRGRIGGSTATLEEAPASKADYIAVGSVFKSPTKPDAKRASLDVLKEIRDKVKKPVVAIGGINQENIKMVREAGADAAAVISSALIGDIEENVRRLKERFYG